MEQPQQKPVNLKEIATEDLALLLQSEFMAVIRCNNEIVARNNNINALNTEITARKNRAAVDKKEDIDAVEDV